MTYQFLEPDERLRKSLKALYTADPDFARIERDCGTPRLRHFEPSFSALVRIIVGQQLATKAADSIWNRLETAAVTVTPETLAAMDDDTLRSLGLSRAKVASVRDLSQTVTSGRLNLAALTAFDDAAVMTALTAIRGIGPWTAEIYLLFGLQRLDVFPAGDLALQVAYQRLKGLTAKPDAKRLTQYIEPLRPNRSLAAHLLWQFYNT